MPRRSLTSPADRAPPSLMVSKLSRAKIIIYFDIDCTAHRNIARYRVIFEIKYAALIAHISLFVFITKRENYEKYYSTLRIKNLCHSQAN